MISILWWSGKVGDNTASPWIPVSFATIQSSGPPLTTEDDLKIRNKIKYYITNQSLPCLALHYTALHHPTVMTQQQMQKSKYEILEHGHTENLSRP